MHHPFTRPKAEDMPLLEAKKLPEVRAEAYDVVLNGVEIGGGSIRIHEPDLQEKMFEVLGITPGRSGKRSLAILLRAFSSARRRTAVSLSASIASSCSSAGAQSIRDVIAFPKNNRGMDLMSNSPAKSMLVSCAIWGSNWRKIKSCSGRLSDPEGRSRRAPKF